MIFINKRHIILDLHRNAIEINNNAIPLINSASHHSYTHNVKCNLTEQLNWLPTLVNKKKYFPTSRRFLDKYSH